jgi:flagellar hook-basal body complex protein FliE
MTAPAASNARLIAENIFYDGFASVAPLQSALRTSCLDEDLALLAPEPSYQYGMNIEVAKTQRLQRQLVAFTMVLGRRLDQVNASIKKSECTQADWSKGINDNLIQLVDNARASQNSILQQQQSATLSIVQGLKFTNDAYRGDEEADFQWVSGVLPKGLVNCLTETELVAFP